MEKLLVICGPTATGKTKLAIALAKKFNGEIVSADSRQVYKGMNIGTGKDLNKNFKFQTHSGLFISNFKLNQYRIGYYEVEGVKIWGYDLISPKEKFSVADYIKFADKIINDITKRGKLPILVGGTGLYIKAVTEGIPTVSIPRNEALRKRLEDKSVEELFEMLAQLDPIKAGSMNSSDKKNPRRLIRGIEIATWRLDKNLAQLPVHRCISSNKNILFIGLNTDTKRLSKNIERRVDERFRAGIEIEIRALLERGVSWESQAMSSLGYKIWKEYFEGKRAKDEVISSWKKEEKTYAKRQITWFKKDSRINWFDITTQNYQNNVEKLVKMWYKTDNDQKN
jgi:tRNA dimethylallyltransferase